MMYNSLPLNYVPENLAQLTRQKIVSWRLSTQTQIQRIDYSDRSEIAQMQLQAGEFEIAHFRIDHLEPIAQQQWSKFRKQMVEFFVVFLGSLAFSTLPQLLADAINRDSLSLGIGLLGGGAATWLTHDRATQGLGKIRRRHDALQALESLSQQQQSYSVQNELVDYFFKGQRTRLLQVEANSLKTPFSADLALAVGVSLLEASAAFIMVQSAGELLATLASVFPIAVIWLAAVFQSDCVEFADASAELVRVYRTLLPTGEVSEEQALHVQQLDAAFKYFIGAVPDHIKSAKAARTQATSEFAQKRIDHLEAESIQAIKNSKLKYRQAIANLPNQFSEQQKFDVAGYRGFEILPEQQQAEQELVSQIAMAAAKLNAGLEEDLKLLQTEYNQQIQKWQRIKTLAEKQLWQTESI